MNDRERLEEIKQTINHPNYTEHNGQEEIYFMVSDNDFNWLIQQAERVEELQLEVNDWRDEAIKWNKRFEESEENHSETIELLHSTASITKRYREALEFYANKDNYKDMPLFDDETMYDENGLMANEQEYAPPAIYYDEGEKARQALEGDNLKSERMKCLYCEKEIDEEEAKKMKEAGVEPFCDNYCFHMYNVGYPCGECSTSFFKGYKPRGYFNTTNN